MARSQSNRTQKAQDPYTDSSIVHPVLDIGANTWSSLSRDLGSGGLRQWGGYVREDYLPQLRGRELATTYREMLDGNATVGAIIFAVTQSMRSVRWREIPANDSGKAQKAAGFAESLRHDMSMTWEDFVAEALTMLGYGYAPMELVYKKREGKKRGLGDVPSSKYNDGLIGFRRIPIRGQDTILHWFFDANGQITGLQQMPWVGRLIDIPIEKLLLFRPTIHKGNPEGRSILRNAVRPHWFIKRLEEMEAILFERLSGLPVIYAPASLIKAAQATPPDPNAQATYAALQKMVNNVRINEQMGIILPSDLWPGTNGPSSHRMYEFRLETPQSGHVVDPNPLIQRYKLDTLKSCLADFIDLGHQARGTQNLAITKIDMFYKAIEGWLHSISSTYNRYGLARVWALNGMDDALMPRTEPDMVSRVDLVDLGTFVSNLFSAGIKMTDPEIVSYLRTQAGMPDVPEGATEEELSVPVDKPAPGDAPGDTRPQRAANAVVRAIARRAIIENKKTARVPEIRTGAVEPEDDDDDDDDEDPPPSPFLSPRTPLRNGHAPAAREAE